MKTLLQAYRANTGRRSMVSEVALPVPANDAPLVLGAGTEITGNIVSKVPVHVLAAFHGRVQGPVIFIAKTAEVTGRFEAGHIVVEGCVADGDLIADLLVLRPGCDVACAIMCRELIVEEGALFEGQYRRHADPLRIGRQFEEV